MDFLFVDWTERESICEKALCVPSRYFGILWPNLPRARCV